MLVAEGWEKAERKEKEYNDSGRILRVRVRARGHVLAMVCWHAELDYINARVHSTMEVTRARAIVYSYPKISNSSTFVARDPAPGI